MIAMDITVITIPAIVHYYSVAIMGMWKMPIAPCAGLHTQLCLYHGDETDGERPISQKGVRCVAIMSSTDDLKQLRQEVSRDEDLMDMLIILAKSELGTDICLKENKKQKRHYFSRIIMYIILFTYPIVIIVLGIILYRYLWGR